MHQLNIPTARPDAGDDAEIKAGLFGNISEKQAAFTKVYDRFAKPLAAFIRESVAPTLDSDEVATVVSSRKW
jgi:hypothetical protein